MIENYVRKSYQKFLVDPVVKRIDHYCSPNFITALACLIGLAVFPLLLWERSFLAVFCLLLSGYLDTLDGNLARQQQRSTPAGTVLDITGDRVVEAAVILGLLGVDPNHRGWLCLGMMGSCLICITSFLVVGIFTKNDTERSFYYSPGLMERTETLLFFIAMILIPQIFKPLAILFIVLVLGTALVRVWRFALTHQ